MRKYSSRIGTSFTPSHPTWFCTESPWRTLNISSRTNRVSGLISSPKYPEPSCQKPIVEKSSNCPFTKFRLSVHNPSDSLRTHYGGKIRPLVQLMTHPNVPET